MKKLTAIVSIFLIGCIQLYDQSQPAEIINIHCVYLINPQGVDSTNPRFTRMMTDVRLGASQKAYQLLISTDLLEITMAQETT